MSNVIDDFISRAQTLTVTDAAVVLDIPVRAGDKGGPCPVCGGKDRFSVNMAKQAWHCRGCDRGGKTGINLAGHVLQLDLHTRTGLLEACAAILNESIPVGAERETDAERAARQVRMEEARRLAAETEAKRDEAQAVFRQKAVAKARGIFLHALVAPHDADRPLRDYLRLRTGYTMDARVFDCIRFDPQHTYWHGLDDFGRPGSRYVGFAMIGPFVDLSGKITGCHETWIDIAHGPKFRPDLGFDEKGEPLPTKKMQGTKMGSLIPLCGEMTARRWMGGEGIETVLAVAGYEGFRTDSFYFAAGDLGNLSGKADPKCSMRQAGTRKRIPGPVPHADQAPGDAIQLPAHVTHFVALADGDSDFLFTANAMARAKARLSAEGRDIGIWWPSRGNDFASMLAGKRA